MLDGILGDVFMQDADLVDAVHEAPQLRNRRPGKSACFVEGLQPLLYLKRLDVLRDGLAKPFDEVIADIVLNDGNGTSGFRADGIRAEVRFEVVLGKGRRT